MARPTPQQPPRIHPGTPPTDCNQVFREPAIDGTNIVMRTRGTGDNWLDVVNEFRGPVLFKELDEMMKAAIIADSDHLCPSL